jgi:hypothetical protein
MNPEVYALLGVSILLGLLVLRRMLGMVKWVVLLGGVGAAAYMIF